MPQWLRWLPWLHWCGAGVRPWPDSAPAIGPAAGQATTTLPAPTAPAAHVQDVGEFAWPAEGCISQPYSEDHPALDIANHTGTPVYAVGDGSVAGSGQDDRHGIHVTLDHAAGYESFYSHLSAAHVETGEHVEKGQEIGLMGSTGLSTGPHLHFEILENGEHRNPTEVLGGGSGKLAPVPPQEHVSTEPADERYAFVWPTSGWLTQGYSDHHYAFDIAAQIGTPVRAAAAGTVKEVDQDDRHGIHITLEHLEGVRDLLLAPGCGRCRGRRADQTGAGDRPGGQYRDSPPVPTSISRSYKTAYPWILRNCCQGDSRLARKQIAGLDMPAQ